MVVPDLATIITPLKYKFLDIHFFVSVILHLNSIYLSFAYLFIREYGSIYQRVR